MTNLLRRKDKELEISSGDHFFLRYKERDASLRSVVLSAAMLLNEESGYAETSNGTRHYPQLNAQWTTTTPSSVPGRKNKKNGRDSSTKIVNREFYFLKGIRERR